MVEPRLKHCSHFFLITKIRDKLLCIFAFCSNLCGDLLAFLYRGEVCNMSFFKSFVDGSWYGKCLFPRVKSVFVGLVCFVGFCLCFVWVVVVVFKQNQYLFVLMYLTNI